VTQTRGSVDLEALTHIYMAEGPFEYPDKPTASFSEDKAVSQPFVTDLDGDGASDLLFLKVSFGVGTIINYFVRGKISIDAEAYLYRDGGFPEKPDYDADFSIEAPDGRERNAYAMGDFTGDGVMDAAFGEDADELVFRKGERGEFLSSRTWLKLELPTFGKAASMQLDANERDDLVIFHPAADNSKRVEVVVF
jgi:hypothetical protein